LLEASYDKNVAFQGRLEWQCRKKLYIFSSIILAAQRKRTMQILSYQQVIHNADFL
jgi:hypothetical protein